MELEVTDQSKYLKTLEQCQRNDPRIEVNQRWLVIINGEVFRRIRILARHPDDIDSRPAWLFKDEPSKMHYRDLTRIGVFPEFNLRYVMTLEANTD